MTKKVNYNFPAEEIRKDLEKKPRGIVNILLPENTSLSDKFKYEICQKILAYQQDNKKTFEEISNLLGLTLTQTIEILRGNTTIMSLDSLTTYAERLHLPLQIKITNKQDKSLNA